MNNTKTRKCPVYGCGKYVKIVGHVDKDTKQDINIDLVGKYHLPGGLLSGSLRKYRCPDGHEFTNK